MHKLILLCIALALAGATSTCVAGTPAEWLGQLYTGDQPQGAFGFGAWPGFQDGWDGLPPADVTTHAGTYLVLYRTSGSHWSGPSGFYSGDRESPIPEGGSKSWHDIRLWSYDYAPRLGDRVGTAYLNSVPAPVGYWGKLALDYVPAHLNWTGDTEWFFPLWTTGGYNVPALPCPVTDDPFNPANVTRMHLTVYTYNPVPEPCSLAVLAMGLAGVGWRLRRR